jgi:hypothetical protein
MNQEEQMQIIKHLMETNEWAYHTMLIAKIRDECAYDGCKEKATHVLYYGDNVVQDDSIHVFCEKHAKQGQRAMEKGMEANG